MEIVDGEKYQKMKKEIKKIKENIREDPTDPENFNINYYEISKEDLRKLINEFPDSAHRKKKILSSFNQDERRWIVFISFLNYILTEGDNWEDFKKDWGIDNSPTDWLAQNEGPLRKVNEWYKEDTSHALINEDKRTWKYVMPCKKLIESEYKEAMDDHINRLKDYFTEKIINNELTIDIEDINLEDCDSCEECRYDNYCKIIKGIVRKEKVELRESLDDKDIIEEHANKGYICKNFKEINKILNEVDSDERIKETVLKADLGEVKTLLEKRLKRVSFNKYFKSLQELKNILKFKNPLYFLKKVYSEGELDNQIKSMKVKELKKEEIKINPPHKPEDESYSMEELSYKKKPFGKYKAFSKNLTYVFFKIPNALYSVGDKDTKWDSVLDNLFEGRDVVFPNDAKSIFSERTIEQLSNESIDFENLFIHSYEKNFIQDKLSYPIVDYYNGEVNQLYLFDLNPSIGKNDLWVKGNDEIKFFKKGFTVNNEELKLEKVIKLKASINSYKTDVWLKINKRTIKKVNDQIDISIGNYLKSHKSPMKISICDSNGNEEILFSLKNTNLIDENGKIIHPNRQMLRKEKVDILTTKPNKLNIYCDEKLMESEEIYEVSLGDFKHLMVEPISNKLEVESPERNWELVIGKRALVKSITHPLVWNTEDIQGRLELKNYDYSNKAFWGEIEIDEVKKGPEYVELLVYPGIRKQEKSSVSDELRRGFLENIEEVICETPWNKNLQMSESFSKDEIEEEKEFERISKRTYKIRFTKELLRQIPPGKQKISIKVIEKNSDNPLVEDINLYILPNLKIKNIPKVVLEDKYQLNFTENKNWKVNGESLEKSKKFDQNTSNLKFDYQKFIHASWEYDINFDIFECCYYYKKGNEIVSLGKEINLNWLLENFEKLHGKESENVKHFHNKNENGLMIGYKIGNKVPQMITKYIYDGKDLISREEKKIDDKSKLENQILLDSVKMENLLSIKDDLSHEIKPLYEFKKTYERKILNINNEPSILNTEIPFRFFNDKDEIKLRLKINGKKEDIIKLRSDNFEMDSKNIIEKPLCKINNEILNFRVNSENDKVGKLEISILNKNRSKRINETKKITVKEDQSNKKKVYNYREKELKSIPFEKIKDKEYQNSIISFSSVEYILRFLRSKKYDIDIVSSTKDFKELYLDSSILQKFDFFALDIEWFDFLPKSDNVVIITDTFWENNSKLLFNNKIDFMKKSHLPILTTDNIFKSIIKREGVT